MTKQQFLTTYFHSRHKSRLPRVYHFIISELPDIAEMLIEYASHLEQSCYVSNRVETLKTDNATKFLNVWETWVNEVGWKQ
jgi:hypothetical protein